jgi:hypothetical protein
VVLPLWFLEGEKEDADRDPGWPRRRRGARRDLLGRCAGPAPLEVRRPDRPVAQRDLDGVPLHGRKVIICFDSDIGSNPAVLRAAVALALMLEDAGAEVRIAYLDSAADGSKQRMDDYLASLPEKTRLVANPLRAVEESARAPLQRHGMPGRVPGRELALLL